MTTIEHEITLANKAKEEIPRPPDGTALQCYHLKPGTLDIDRERLFASQLSRIQYWVRIWFNGADKLIKEDLEQECLIGYYNALQNADMNSYYHTYCLNNAKWAGIAFLRRQKKDGHMFGLDTVEDNRFETDEIDVIEHSEMNATINHMLNTMSEKHRNIILDTFFRHSDLTRQQISDKNHISLRAAGNVVSNFKRQLQDAVNEQTMIN